MIGVMPQALLHGRCLDKRNLILAATSEAQALSGRSVNREVGSGGAVLGAHIADCCAIVD
jgi:hypothetical protein